MKLTKYKFRVNITRVITEEIQIIGTDPQDARESLEESINLGGRRNDTEVISDEITSINCGIPIACSEEREFIGEDEEDSAFDDMQDMPFTKG
jgi:hypothetical protein